MINTISIQETDPLKVNSVIRQIVEYENFQPSIMLGGWKQAVNLNSATTDNEIRIKSPWQYYKLYEVMLRNTGTTASITTATAGLFTATGAGGTALAATQVLTMLTSKTVNVAGNMMSLTLSSSNQWQNRTSLYFRVVAAQGAAATADVYIFIIPLPDVPPQQ